MKKKRRTHSPEFKARVAMEALRGIKPVHQISNKYSSSSRRGHVSVRIHPDEYRAVKAYYLD